MEGDNKMALGTSAKVSSLLKVSIFPVCGVRLLADIKPCRPCRPSLQSEKIASFHLGIYFRRDPFIGMLGFVDGSLGLLRGVLG